MENLYDNEKEYWIDVQLNTTECDKCGIDMGVCDSYPVKFENKGYPISNGYIFVCAPCKTKSIYNLRKELL